MVMGAYTFLYFALKKINFKLTQKGQIGADVW